MSAELHEVRCSSCRRLAGMATIEHFTFYCDDFCREDIPASTYEADYALIEALLQDKAASLREVARRAGRSHQFVHKMLLKRDLREAA